MSSHNKNHSYPNHTTNMSGYQKKIYNLTLTNSRRALSNSLVNYEKNKHSHSFHLVSLKCMTCDLNVMFISEPDVKFANVYTCPCDIVIHENLDLNRKVNKVLSFGDSNGCCIVALVETVK